MNAIEAVNVSKFFTGLTLNGHPVKISSVFFQVSSGDVPQPR